MQPATDKLIARKAGAIGWVIFNNPQKHNAMSMAMTQAMGVVAQARSEGIGSLKIGSFQNHSIIALK